MSRPEKDTPEYDLWIAAIEVAIDPPFTQNRTASNAHVNWARIHELRAALEAVGVDWRHAKGIHDKALREAQLARRTAQ